MDEAILYDLIAERTIYKWRDEIERDDDLLEKKAMTQDMDLLYEAVGENNRKLVNHFKISVENYYSYIFFNVNIKLINICIKIGMEMQKFYDKEFDE